ncbi:MAG: hypothetical protein ACXADO_06090 [Candidatus Thorarchaeota archaeon]|jgi:hypothetical protein
MVNKEKAVRREVVRLRKTQNPQQVDFRRMRRMRKARIKLWSLKNRGVVGPKVVKEKKEKAKRPRKKKEPELEIIEDEPEFEFIEELTEPVVKEKKKAKKPKKEKEPELEVIEDESDPDFIDKELADLYSYDEEIDEEELDEEK